MKLTVNTQVVESCFIGFHNVGGLGIIVEPASTLTVLNQGLFLQKGK